MSAPLTEARVLRLEALSALQAGDPATARSKFERIISAGLADAAVCAALAMACRNLGDLPAMLAAADKALAIDPKNLPALILKGEYLQATADPRQATAFYGIAVALAERTPGLPPSLAQMVDQARIARDRINADIERHLRVELERYGYDEERSNARFTRSLELLTGRKRRYTQQPRAYYYPELPDTQFYPRALFPWLDRVEAATDDICEELAGVLERKDTFTPYIQRAAGGPEIRRHGLLDSLDWSVHFLWKDGSPVAANADKCPKTLAALSEAPLARIAGRSPSILFSQLRPGAHIAPHTGYLNCRLICHLPLIVPPGCRLRVGNEEREWRRGRAWVFNDTIEHEARNTSDRPRVVLIFDVWHPELSAEEREHVAVLMHAVDSYAGSPPARWDD